MLDIWIQPSPVTWSSIPTCRPAPCYLIIPPIRTCPLTNICQIVNTTHICHSASYCTIMVSACLFYVSCSCLFPVCLLPVSCSLVPLPVTCSYHMYLSLDLLWVYDLPFYICLTGLTCLIGLIQVVTLYLITDFRKFSSILSSLLVCVYIWVLFLDSQGNQCQILSMCNVWRHLKASINYFSVT